MAARIRKGPVSHPEASKLVAVVAEALHYTHGKGLVHRDVKPANILLDATGKPYVADFGVALKEENLGQGPNFAGTIPYMSPEQAAGKAHRVDCRSDIFSLGVVFYELLTSKRPFRADSQNELLEQIAFLEPLAPRQLRDAIPEELERICLKARAKKVSERYPTAKAMAEDLRYFWPGCPTPRRARCPLRGLAATQSRLSPRVCGRLSGTMPTFSWNSYPDHEIGMVYPTASASGKLTLRRPTRTILFLWA